MHVTWWIPSNRIRVSLAAAPIVRLPRVKIGIVVPFSWSFWGAVVEHAELQAAALEARGHDVRLVMGNDPPGQFTRALHPRVGRHGHPPRAPARALRRAAPARADDAGDLHRGARARDGAGRRDPPRVRRPRLDA